MATNSWEVEEGKGGEETNRRKLSGVEAAKARSGRGR
jgi:hypothetical protein